MPTLSPIPYQWGPKAYNQTKVLVMRSNSFFEPLIKLPGFSLGAPEPETKDAVVFPEFTLESGFLRERSHYARKAFNTSYKMTIGLLPGSVWSPLNSVANARGLCKRDFFAVALCSEDDRYSHFIAYPSGILSEPKQTNDVITVTGDAEAMATETELTVTRTKLYWATGLQEQQTYNASKPLYDIAFLIPECQQCDLNMHDNGVFVGGDGTAVPDLQLSDDKFATSSAITNSIPAGSVATSVTADGDVVIVTFADDPDPATATTGGICVSTDGGSNTSIVTSTTDAMFGTCKGGSYYWAVGKDGAIYRSNDITNWSSVSSSYTTADQLVAIAHDASTGYLYIAGYDAANGLAAMIDGDIVSDISTEVNAGTNNLYDVAVLGDDHVCFVGASGTCREHENASYGTTFNTVNVAGSTDNFRVVEGDTSRTIVAGGTHVYERSPMNDMLYTLKEANAGTTITGDYMGGCIGETFDGANYFALVTDDSEVVVLQPFTPDA